MSLIQIIRQLICSTMCTTDIRGTERTLLKTPDGKFRGSFVNIKAQWRLHKADPTRPIKFDSFPTDGSSDPADRSSEFIHLDLHKPSLIGNILRKIIDETKRELCLDPVFLKVLGERFPALADWRAWETKLYTTIADKLHESNPAFFRYRLGVNLHTGESTHCIKTQNLTDLDIDLARDVSGVGPVQFKYVCNCETFSTLVGTVGQKIANDMLGVVLSGHCFYTIASSNYRVEEGNRVEHAMLMTARDVTMPDGSIQTIAHFVDPSSYNLQLRGIYNVGDRNYTLNEVVLGVRFIASADHTGFPPFYAVDLYLPPPDAYTPAPTPVLPPGT